MFTETVGAPVYGLPARKPFVCDLPGRVRSRCRVGEVGTVFIRHEGKTRHFVLMDFGDHLGVDPELEQGVNETLRVESLKRRSATLCFALAMAACLAACVRPLDAGRYPHGFTTGDSMHYLHPSVSRLLYGPPAPIHDPWAEGYVVTDQTGHFYISPQLRAKLGPKARTIR